MSKSKPRFVMLTLQFQVQVEGFVMFAEPEVLFGNLDELCCVRGLVMIIDHGDSDDEDGYPAYSHHDKIPPWWEYVSYDKGGNLSVSKSHHI